MNEQTGENATQNPLGRFVTLPWWRWWGRAQESPPTNSQIPGAGPASRSVVSVENGFHSEPQDVPSFIQRFVMAVAAQEDSKTIPTVDWWEIFTDPDDPALAEPFRELLTGDSEAWNVEPAFQSIRITLHDSRGNQETEVSIAFFRVSEQGTRCFVGHVPLTHVWLWGCSMWTMEKG